MMAVRKKPTSEKPKEFQQMAKFAENAYKTEANLNAKRLFLDFASIGGLLVAVATVTWMVSTERNAIQTKLESLDQRLTTFIDKFNASNTIAWTKVDHLNWCLRAERRNPNWVCPNDDLGNPHPAADGKE